jgi:hypothetical protein
MWDKCRAELVTPPKTAILSCGCVGVVLSHDEGSVHFGIERPCKQHQQGDFIELDKQALVTPTEFTYGD